MHDVFTTDMKKKKKKKKKGNNTYVSNRQLNMKDFMLHSGLKIEITVAVLRGC